MEADDMSLRVASFSCYLNNPEESFVQRIGGSSDDFPPPDTPPPLKTSSANNNNHHHRVVKPSSNAKLMKQSKNNSFAFKTAADDDSFGLVEEDPTVSFVFPKHMDRRIIRNEGEISIFGADKYFNNNTKLESSTATRSSSSGGGNKLIKYKKGEILEINQIIPPVESSCTKKHPKSSTASVCSEPSSLGSQTVLLHNKTKPKKTTRPRLSLFGGLVCHGRSCLDKKAVNVIDEHTYESKPSDHFQRNSKRQEEAHNVTDATASEEVEEEQRKSLEVFGEHDRMRSNGRDVAVNLERKLSVLTWDAIPNGSSQDINNRHVPTPTATIGCNNSTIICDDIASDASSDLFEIENISNSTRCGLMTLPSHHQIATVDDASSPINPYAPREASISWSVITADHSSVISSDYYDERSTVTTVARKTGRCKNVTGKSSPRFGLLGCNSHGAVDITECAYNNARSDRRKLGKSVHNCQYSLDDLSSPCML